MPLRTLRDDTPTLNLTPMIDVVFLLIIFFMVGTKFTELERRISLSVPRVADGRGLATGPARCVVNVHRDGRLTFNQEEIRLEQLAPRLTEVQRQSNTVSVLVRGDAEGPLQHVATVLGACREAGISEMGISVRVARRDSPR